MSKSIEMVRSIALASLLCLFSSEGLANGPQNRLSREQIEERLSGHEPLRDGLEQFVSGNSLSYKAGQAVRTLYFQPEGTFRHAWRTDRETAQGKWRIRKPQGRMEQICIELDMEEKCYVVYLKNEEKSEYFQKIAMVRQLDQRPTYEMIGASWRKGVSMELSGMLKEEAFAATLRELNEDEQAASELLNAYRSFLQLQVCRDRINPATRFLEEAEKSAKEIEQKLRNAKSENIIWERAAGEIQEQAKLVLSQDEIKQSEFCAEIERYGSRYLKEPVSSEKPF